jgi:hypothetical protein
MSGESDGVIAAWLADEDGEILRSIESALFSVAMDRGRGQTVSDQAEALRVLSAIRRGRPAPEEPTERPDQMSIDIIHLTWHGGGEVPFDAIGPGQTCDGDTLAWTVRSDIDGQIICECPDEASAKTVAYGLSLALGEQPGYELLGAWPDSRPYLAEYFGLDQGPPSDELEPHSDDSDGDAGEGPDEGAPARESTAPQPAHQFQPDSADYSLCRICGRTVVVWCEGMAADFSGDGNPEAKS